MKAVIQSNWSSFKSEYSKYSPACLIASTSGSSMFYTWIVTSLSHMTPFISSASIAIFTEQDGVSHFTRPSPSTPMTVGEGLGSETIPHPHESLCHTEILYSHEARSLYLFLDSHVSVTQKIANGFEQISDSKKVTYQHSRNPETNDGGGEPTGKNQRQMDDQRIAQTNAGWKRIGQIGIDLKGVVEQKIG